MATKLVKTVKSSQDDFLKVKLMEVIQSKKSYPEILEYINNEIKESTRIIEFNYRIKCFLEDGAYALHRAVESIHGFTTQKDIEGMSNTKPPAMIDVRFADGTRKKVPFGQIDLPSLGKGAMISMDYDHDDRNLLLSGRCEKRYVALMDEMVEETNKIVIEDSIYKGKAIKINDLDTSPEFIDLSGIDKIDLFLTPEAQFSTEPIEARIEHTDICIREGIDLKFGVLLEGAFGTGKTLYAFKLALKAINNGWTFIYCPNAEYAQYIMETSEMLSGNGKGVVLFIEDIDRILNVRDENTNEISILMDGGESKNKNVITILTTNHIEDIDPAFLRGKRIGSVISLTYPDKDTAKKMINKYLVNNKGESILEEDCDIAAQEIEDNKIVPAFVAEILDRVKSHLIYSGKKTVSCQDIVNSIRSYRRQMEIATVKLNTKNDAEQLVDSLRKTLGNENVKDSLYKVLTEKGF